MNNLMQGSISCPSCGHDHFDPERQCTCGYQADESFMIESFIAKSEKKDSKGNGADALKNPVKSPRNRQGKEIVIKEIDSWMISFSPVDNSISLGTPALQSFRLKLQLQDVEELLDILYHMTGQEKTTRKLSLSPEEIQDLMKQMHDMIEEKRSKMKVTFSEGELNGMSDIINNKLKSKI